MRRRRTPCRLYSRSSRKSKPAFHSTLIAASRLSSRADTDSLHAATETGPLRTEVRTVSGSRRVRSKTFAAGGSHRSSRNVEGNLHFGPFLDDVEANARDRAPVRDRLARNAVGQFPFLDAVVALETFAGGVVSADRLSARNGRCVGEAQGLLGVLHVRPVDGDSEPLRLGRAGPDGGRADLDRISDR